MQYTRQNQHQSHKLGLQYLAGKGDMHKHIFFIKRLACIYLYENGLSETASSYAVFKAKHFSTILWEESVYIQY